MFATIVIVLPSEFSGGEVHVSHGKQQKVFDFSDENLLSTTVLSWYTDVVHEVKPITSGFRLALSYNLIHTPQAPHGKASVSLPPRLPHLDEPMQRLERVLRGWKYADRHGVERATGQKPPQKLAYLLEHEYSHANLSFDELKGRDANRMLSLRDVCARVGFQLGLGSLDYTETGYAVDDGGGRDDGWDDDEDDEDDEDVAMCEVEERSCVVQLISGPNGECWGREEELDMEEVMVANGYWDKAGPDDQEYEGYQGNVRHPNSVHLIGMA